MLKWEGESNGSLARLRFHRKGTYPVLVGRVDADRQFYIWPGFGVQGEAVFPWPEGMELGDELRAYVEAQWYLLDKP